MNADGKVIFKRKATDHGRTSNPTAGKNKTAATSARGVTRFIQRVRVMSKTGIAINDLLTVVKDGGAWMTKLKERKLKMADKHREYMAKYNLEQEGVDKETAELSVLMTPVLNKFQIMTDAYNIQQANLDLFQ